MGAIGAVCPDEDRGAGQGWATWWTQGFIRLRVGGGLGPSKLSALPPINASKSAVPS